MLHNTRGIVFRTVKYSESSVIATIYTEKFGLQSYMINGIRSTRSKNKATLLQPLTLLNLVVYHRENKNLQRIKEIGFNYIFQSIPFDIIKGSIGLFLLEVLNKSIKEEEANPDLFNYILLNIQHLDQQQENINNFHLAFLLHLTKYLGFAPADNQVEKYPYFDLREGLYLSQQPHHPDFLEMPFSKYFDDLSKGVEIKITNSERKKLLANILYYYEMHVEHFKTIKSFRILESVLH